MKRTVALIGCSKEKSITADGVRHPVPVRELYSSDLFRKRVAYCEQRGLRWCVLSAKHGLVQHFRELRYYDETFGSMDRLRVAAWAPGVVVQFLDMLCDDDVPSDLTVELHAGAEYCKPLAQMLELVGITVELPVRGLSIGKQLQFYSEHLTEPTKLQPVT